MDLSLLSTGTLSYTARRTSTFDSTGIVVEASLDGGITFPIVLLAPGQALPGATSSYQTMFGVIPQALIGESAVQIRFRAFGDTGGNTRIDDVEILGIGTIGLSTFGFSQSSTVTISGDDSVAVNVSVEVLPAAADLFGLQFDLVWSAQTTVIGVQRGPAVSDSGQWDLAVQLGSGSGRIVLLGRVDSGLPAGSYPGLLRILVTPSQNDSTSARLDTLLISGVLGSKSEDTGDDAFIAAGILTHVMSVVMPVASFQVAPDSLDFGLISIDSVASSSVNVSNPLGTAVLEVSLVTSNNSAITVAPISFSTDPGDSTVVVVTVDASQLASGPFGEFITFTHNGASSPDSIWVAGRVGALDTRGDVNDDGVTDLIDLVLAVDHVVGRVALPSELVDRIDLYPFPVGDGSSDVRDLTILVRAINKGVWPDGELLPSPESFAKGESQGLATLYLSEVSGIRVIRVSYSPGLRAIHLVFASNSERATLRPEDFSSMDHGSLVQTHIDRYRGPSSRYVGILAYTLEGPLTNGPVFTVARVPSSVAADSLRLVFASGVDQSNRRVLLEFSGLVEAPEESLPGFLPAFPQPFSLSRHRLVRIGVELIGAVEVDVRITDVLGRTVFTEHRVSISERLPFSWNGTTNSGPGVSPGVYFVTLSSEAGQRTVPIVVAR